VLYIVGLPCVAKFHLSGTVQRSFSLASSGIATVVYVDYGSTESLPLSDLRKLLHHFLELPSQVIAQAHTFIYFF